MIYENLIALKKRVDQACKRVNRDPKAVKIVAVTKARSIEDIKELVSSGVADIGENRVQEALFKHTALTANYVPITDNRSPLTEIKWHMVGHLQTNKAKESVEIFDIIHSLDSLRLAKELDVQAARIKKIQDILIQVNVSKENTKSGVSIEGLQELVRGMWQLKNLRLLGLMTIAPVVDDPNKARPFFRALRELLEDLRDQFCDDDGRHRLQELSMGMTDDFEAAIEEGSTMLRIGRAIFDPAR